MPSFRRSVPSLTALVALEAAVRHQSFTLAARELGVTQTAVSRQIAALEAELETQLFSRLHRAIEATPECLRLAAGLRNHFAGITDCVNEFRATAANGALTLGVTSAVSQLWLLPRLVEFRRNYPHARIRVLSTDEPLNLESDNVDIAVRYGVAPFKDGQVVASREDVLFPVASADYAQRLSDPARFWEGSYELIHEDMSEPSWYTWQDWFNSANIGRRVRASSLSFNHYTEILYAARAGEGIALGWQLLVQTFLEDGTLVRLGGDEILADGKFHVVVSHRARPSLTLETFIDWLSRELRGPG